MASDRDRTGGRNLRMALTLGGLACAMVGLSFASVPLYRIFCQVTGFGGTTQVSERAPGQVGERVFKIRFNADVNQDMPWDFRPLAREVSLKAGEPGLAFYRAENLSSLPVTGTATFNVTPLKAGAYFNKIQCFCFEEQNLAPGETAELGVSFFVDPAILEDPSLDDVAAITLSYTFFRAPQEEPAPGAGGRQQAAARTAPAGAD